MIKKIAILNCLYRCWVFYINIYVINSINKFEVLDKKVQSMNSNVLNTRGCRWRCKSNKLYIL